MIESWNWEKFQFQYHVINCQFFEMVMIDYIKDSDICDSIFLLRQTGWINSDSSIERSALKLMNVRHN